ncbi:hypothetical protein [Haliangium sp. UPWRP_2]|uniref:hypothetical protein n=1 Tax=Haliangium sp. UPWRP_2 TaxID=1931276 RepID=UPI000B542EDF|nr:hypothetical protein [Haliangium sp. UPWRP_2]PSM31637.1 hypothetical protein BVG81_004375 [Haliangium sp. UPWRP_2]
MAKDITIRVTGQNPDGTMTVQQVDGGNPFMTGQPQTTALAPYTPPGQMTSPAQPGGYRATINGVQVTFASEADYLKADRALRDMIESQNIPSLGGMPAVGGGGGGGGGGRSWLRTGANAADTVAGFLNGRNIRRKLEDLEDALADSRDARAELDTLTVKFPDLIPVLRRLFLAERDATEASVSVLEDQLTAVDIQTGSAVAKVAADFMGDRPASPAGGGDGIGTALAVGGAGLGLGLLMSNSRDDRGGRRRRPR